ncbi:MAG TPA: DUF2970 domain-containing protein [Ramlibacter sp.]|uniref:DUF2970 domain-containing protein n=1 Tax=Ramlibacter sp. TaxID=1917967 RepID=UPI002ED0C54F
MSVIRTVKAVLWAFLGIRKKSAYEEDLGKLSPFQIISVALGVVVMFVVGLVVLVNWVVKN